MSDHKTVKVLMVYTAHEMMVDSRVSKSAQLSNNV